jgi:hypothetical protein
MQRPGVLTSFSEKNENNLITLCTLSYCFLGVLRKTIGNGLLVLGAYAPFTRKTNFKMSKKLGKIFVYLHILCSHAQFRGKRTFLWVVQKSCEKAYFTTEFCHLYIGHIKSRFFFLKTTS